MSSVHQRQLDDNDWPSWSDWVTRLTAPGGDGVIGHVTPASDDVTTAAELERLDRTTAHCGDDVTPKRDDVTKAVELERLGHPTRPR